jgi:hypothetical protein
VRDGDVGVLVVAGSEHEFELIALRAIGLLAPQREIRVDVFALLRGEELFDGRSQLWIVCTLTTTGGRQGDDEDWDEYERQRVTSRV